MSKRVSQCTKISRDASVGLLLIVIRSQSECRSSITGPLGDSRFELQWPKSEASRVSDVHGLELIQYEFGKALLIVGRSIEPMREDLLYQPRFPA
jgi:hypothetical protein